MARRRIAVLDNEPVCVDVIQDRLQDEDFEVVTLVDLRAGHAFVQPSCPGCQTRRAWMSLGR